MTSNLHILSLNAQGLRNKEKRMRLKEYIRLQKVDIVFLQETHFTADISNTVRLEFEQWHIINSYGTNTSKGCSILTNKSLSYEILDFTSDTLGRYIILNISIDETIYSLINIYAYNDKVSRNNFYQNINSLVELHAQGLKIIGGDMNDVLSSLDRYNVNREAKSCKTPVASLTNLIKYHDLADPWREKNKNKRQYTWRRKNGNEKSRIDFWLVEKNIMPLVIKTDIRPACIKTTDHLGISLKLSKKTKRGPGFWKFNNMYLKDQEYSNLICRLIENNSRKYQNESNKSFWELLKIDIKEASLKFAKAQSRKRKEKIIELEDRLANLLNTCNDGQTDEHTQTDITRLENEIQQLYDITARGAQIRSRVEFIEEGEKSTKYFLNLEKSRQARKSVTSLNVNGKLICDNYKILDEEVKFYQTLYKSNDGNINDINNYLDATTFCSTLTDDEANICEGKFDLNELSEALKHMKPNKSPGLDGLTAEFYKHFWPLLGRILLRCLNDCFDDTELTNSQKISVLSLLYKKGDPSDLENWRPISLLNIDYKIAARTLANRLKKVIHKIIHLDQQGYIQNRFIGYNLRQIQDVIDYAEDLQLEGAILFLDFRKAFDTIEWNFLFTVLQKFGFKETFIQWIKVLYFDCKSCIFNYGHRSSIFNPFRGIRQGCPISALLYILAAEVMAINIRNSELITGIEISLLEDKKTLKISQLADDTTLFLKNEKDIISAISIVKEYGKHSGLNLNENKTEGMWIGKNKLDKNPVGGINWPDRAIKALGVYFGHSKQECIQLNWETKLNSCKKIIENWNKRTLTFYGKIQIIKSLLIPKFTYLFHSLIVPKEIVNRINTIIYDFLWSGKREKIKRNTLIGSKLKGGLEMIDLDSYIRTIKLKWIKALTSDEDANWKLIPTYSLEKYGKHFLIFYTSLDSIKSIDTNNIPEFYKNILEIWIQSNSPKSNNDFNYREIRKQIIWGNRFIKYKGKCLFFNNWIKSGLIFINDVINDNGAIKAEYILQKLKDKRNWISEYTKLINAIPKKWKKVLVSEISRKTNVMTTYDIRLGNLKFKECNNKCIYQLFTAHKFQCPIMHNYWNSKFEETLPWSDFYSFLNRISDNRIKQYKYKTINRIFPCRNIRWMWKMENSPNCLNCNVIEDYDHVFIECAHVQLYWSKILELFKKCGIEANIKNIKTLLIGYKISNSDYFYVNMILSVIGFCIYKSYFISNNWLLRCDIYKVFINEVRILLHFLSRKNVKCSFMSKLRRCLE